AECSLNDAAVTNYVGSQNAGCSEGLTCGRRPALELTRYVERDAEHVIESIRPEATLWITRQRALARELGPVSVVEPEIPAGQHVTPLGARAEPPSVGGGTEGITGSAGKETQSERVIKPIPIIQQPRADEQTTPDVIDVEAYPEVLMLRNRAARS